MSQQRRSRDHERHEPRRSPGAGIRLLARREPSQQTQSSPTGLQTATFCLLLALATGLSAVTSGCGSKTSGAATHEVYGRITINGSPVAGVQVMVLPVGKTKSPGASGITDADGRFEVMGRGGEKGVVEGEYDIVYSKLDVPAGGATGGGAMKETLPKQYSDPTVRRPPVSIEPGGREINADLTVPGA